MTQDLGTLVLSLGMYSWITFFPWLGWLYSESDVCTHCTHRLDLYFIMTHLSFVPAVMVAAPECLDYLRGPWFNFARMGILWFCLLGIGLSLQNIYAVWSCWQSFRLLEMYTNKHFTVFMMFGFHGIAFALWMPLVAFFFCAELSEYISNFWKSNHGIKRSLKEWKQAHQSDPSAQGNAEKLSNIITHFRVQQRNIYSPGAKVCILENFYAGVVFQRLEGGQESYLGYKNTAKSRRAKERPDLVCSICDTIIETEDLYCTGIDPVAQTVHFECFGQSQLFHKVLSELTAEICMQKYLEFRGRYHKNSH